MKRIDTHDMFIRFPEGSEEDLFASGIALAVEKVMTDEVDYSIIDSKHGFECWFYLREYDFSFSWVGNSAIFNDEAFTKVTALGLVETIKNEIKRVHINKITPAKHIGWQPIETAPKDGTQILVRDGIWTSVADYQPGRRYEWQVSHWTVCTHYEWKPTHWMPLLELPTV